MDGPALEAFADHADINAWSTAGVDALGWTRTARRRIMTPEMLFLVERGGLTKTLYPLVTAPLGIVKFPEVSGKGTHQIATGTHAATLATLEFLGRPALNIQTRIKAASRMVMG